MVRRVHLDKNKHAVSMMRGLKEMRHEQELCDFIIIIQGVEYRAHRVVLALGSPYFKAMLIHDTKESQEGKVKMLDVDSECVKSCIESIYNGSFDIPDGKLGALLHVAIMMQLENVKHAIRGILVEELSVVNFYETRNIADMYDLGDVTSKCKIFYEHNFMEISAQPGFAIERKPHLVSILKSKKVNLSEEEKLKVILRWIGETSEKSECLLQLITFVDLTDVSTQYSNDLLENHPLISNDLRLFKLINAHMVENLKKARVTTSAPSVGSIDDKKKSIILFDRANDRFCCYYPSTNNVTYFRDAKFIGFDFPTAVFMDSYIYILSYDQSVLRLNIKVSNSKWETMRDMIIHHGFHPPAVTLSGSIFVIGSGGSTPTKHVEKFDPAINQWLQLRDKPRAVTSASLVSLDECIYCIGGLGDGKTYLKTLSKFIPLLQEWVDLQPMKLARAACGAVAVNQKIFVMGGYCDGEKLNEVEYYDVYSEQWTSLSPMIERHGAISAHCFNGSIVSVPFGRLHHVEKYDVANDKWNRVIVEDVYVIGVQASVTIDL